MPEDADNGKIVLELKNVRPLDLDELGKCLTSAAADFRKFVSDRAGDPEPEEARLFVREVRQGSTIIELVAASYSFLPGAISYASQLFDFFKDLKAVLGHLKHEPTDEKPKLDKQRLERMNNLVQPIATDSPGAQFNIIYIEKGGKLGDTVSISMADANTIQNTARKEIASLREPVAGYHDRAVLYFFQTRDDTRSASGDKAIIERFGRSPIKTIFATEEAKAHVLGVKGNIFRHAFVVDVRVDTIDEKPVLYTVMRVHDFILREVQTPLPFEHPQLPIGAQPAT